MTVQSFLKFGISSELNFCDVRCFLKETPLFFCMSDGGCQLSLAAASSVQGTAKSRILDPRGC